MIVLNVTYTMKENVSPADFVNALEEMGWLLIAVRKKAISATLIFIPLMAAARSCFWKNGKMKKA